MVALILWLTLCQKFYITVLQFFMLYARMSYDLMMYANQTLCVHNRTLYLYDYHNVKRILTFGTNNKIIILTFGNTFCTSDQYSN